MIPRYSRDLVTNIWSQEEKYKIWLDIEIYAAEAMEKYKIIPKGVAAKVRKKSKINVKRIDDIEKITKHDVIAFLTSIAEKVGPEAKFLHQGMTSSDVLDTCFNIQLQRSGKILLNDVNELLKTLKQKAYKHKNTICMGRSHGIHAEPITFGLKLATYYEEFKRNKKRLEDAVKEISTCAISGAVGTFAHITPKVEEYVAKKLNLKPEPISTQVIPRDRHAQFFSVLGIIASSAERLATEIRHLQRTEVLEAEEYFSSGQKGSSAMPHKRNPVLSENITGLARLVRSYVFPAMENIVLWHERDISHSSVERNIGPDATVTLDFLLSRLNGVVKNLVVHKDNMTANMNKFKGLVFSQGVMLKLTQKGVKREDAYKTVQYNAMKTWDNNEDFYTNLSKDKLIKKYLTTKELEKLFDLNYHTKNVNHIFSRVFK
ncbi:MAG: adenylosuccinate lyase [Proteobacteria bacterium]|jgi:adenylosuccinate lyase|nr:adenylosuccinate lyase [Pseudomonadota bacterium]MDA0996225.1 adenylosuccinate lyase [Pseudomonadota bacterium]